MATLKDLTTAFEEIAVLLDLMGENPFKGRAYANAARIVQSGELGLADLAARSLAGEIKGIGKGLAEKIDELQRTGEIAYLNELRAAFPAGLLEMLRIPGLGAKKIRTLHQELGIQSVGDLEEACRENHLLKVAGFGAKSQENILAGIERLRRFSGLFLYSTARRIADELLAHLRATGLAERLAIGGSLRRRKEIVKDIDLLAASSQPARLMEAFVNTPGVAQITGHGETKSSVVLAGGIAVDLRVVDETQYAAAWVHFTGSKEHNTQLRSLAKDQNRKLSEYGLFENDAPLPLRDETDLYRRLGLHFVPPELREGLGEIERAARGDFPALVDDADVQGVLHAHTTYSDGQLTLRQLALLVRDRGYHYLGVTDHSQSAAYAGGLKPDDLKRQHDEIDALNEELAPFIIFKGIESDILADGRLDYDERELAAFDFVIASVHSRFNLGEEEMTRRIVAALENPYTTILGHPTGRLLLSRDGYAVNLPAVLDAAARCGVAVEINANPHRLDLDWRHHRRARELGIPIPICPDAHTPAGLDDIAYGVGTARKGGLTKEDVPTCWPAARLAEYFTRRKQ
ncbi:MAG: DNA polymerase/3'-5' exonuclease PolX [Myxococcales bacterium]|nr:DNA polymerase/3'-5' exonuclease PolX [Myxococcales bacterium]